MWSATGESVRACFIAVFLPLTIAEGNAGGFYVPQKGAIGVGLASAGGAARTYDPSIVYFNPAGMTELGGRTVQVGVDLLLPDVKLSNGGSTATTPGTFGAAVPVTGSGGDAGTFTPIPTVFYAQPLGDRGLWVGLAVTAPFGLGLDYGDGWFGRYDSIESKLLTLDIAPSVAYRITPSWSIGGGIDVQYARASLTNAIPNTLNFGGPTPATDGSGKVTGDAWSVGFNVGTLFNVTPSTRVGLSYRSGISHNLKGDATVTGLTGPLAVANGESATSTRLNLPSMAALAVTHQFSPAWTLLAELQWYGWSVFDETRITFSNGLPDSVRPQNFRNTWSIAAGAEYKLSARWTLRGGIKYDPTPTVDAFRNTSIPDSDLLWIGLGASYHFSPDVALDFAYLNANFQHADINLVTPFFAGTPAAGTVNTVGRTGNVVNTLALSVRFRF